MERFETEASPNKSSKMALDVLRQMVAQHASTPQRALPTERELAAEFGASRRAIRHALAVLEAEGRIWRRQGKGTYVGPTPPSASMTFAKVASRTNFSEVMEARLYLEPALASLAAVRASGEQMAILRRLVERTSFQQGVDETDAESIELWDSALHRAIAEASGNRLMLDLFEMLDAIRLDPVWRDLRHRARSNERLEMYSHDHDDIVSAIESRDPVKAATAMRGHLRALQQALEAVVQQDLEASL
ncbi:FadR family transcriptional regulator [Pseudomonas tolaasii]|uniref:FadR family transcriptional regulator n=2 Tax=Pseudomonas tolaasii TaxID=29442 RepID=A0A7Y8DRM9_PSETO|nr:FCD domain-containing protein [Pseudomonas tolaasii]ARB30421.1 GntR family transcriptional regulator [Pseudomonas tolaasii]KAB0478436.1 FadR family transcriptional regulator [Pseudomonas tolaasii]MBW1249340.1 FadR family transcriptional regulator [Pseudomonas tolaasii]MBY8942529.1 FadR family transcriptional regulator [Pseudomonas tolaasii]NVZ45021.1 FadR family transcriptional regulator [Pseudomonas tolaasii]